MNRRLFVLSTALWLGGCATEMPAGRAGHPPTVINSSGENMSLDQALDTDPCAVRMRDIEAALLMYYAVHKELPPSLETLTGMNAGEPLNFSSPVTGVPFGYSANGMVAPGRSKRIIVYETIPEHAGRRWCIRMPLTDPGAAQSTEVVEMRDGEFAKYLKNG